MCRQRTALEMIKTQQDHCGLSDSALLLHEKQCEDFELMQKEINRIQQDLQEVKQSQNEMNQKIDNLISIFHKKESLLQNLKDILNNKVFLYILITIVCMVLGVSASEMMLNMKEVASAVSEMDIH